MQGSGFFFRAWYRGVGEPLGGHAASFSGRSETDFSQEMKGRFSVVCLAVLCCFVATAAFAQNAAGKAAAASSVVNQFVFSTGTGTTTTPFVTVVSTNIKPPGGKDLFINFSAVTAVLAQSVNNDDIPLCHSPSPSKTSRFSAGVVWMVRQCPLHPLPH